MERVEECSGWEGAKGSTQGQSEGGGGGGQFYQEPATNTPWQSCKLPCAQCSLYHCAHGLKNENRAYALLNRTSILASVHIMLMAGLHSPSQSFLLFIIIATV